MADNINKELNYTKEQLEDIKKLTVAIEQLLNNKFTGTDFASQVRTIEMALKNTKGILGNSGNQISNLIANNNNSAQGLGSLIGYSSNEEKRIRNGLGAIVKDINALVNVKSSVEQTTQAYRQLSEAEQEAEMRAALMAAHTITKPDKNIEKKTEQIKEQTQAVESLGKKVKELSADNFYSVQLSDDLNINLSRVKEYNKIYESLRNVQGNGTPKQVKDFETLKQLAEEIKKNLQEAFSKNPEGYISMLQRNGGSREDVLNVLKSAGISIPQNDGYKIKTPSGTFGVSEETFKRIETIDKLHEIYRRMVPKYEDLLFRANTEFSPISRYDKSENDLIKNGKDNFEKGGLILSEEYHKNNITRILTKTIGNRKEMLDSIKSMLEKEDNQFAKELLQVLENDNEKINEAIQRQNKSLFSDSDIKKIRGIARKKITKDNFYKSQKEAWIKNANPYDIINAYPFSTDEYKSIRDIFSGDKKVFDKINEVINKRENNKNPVQQQVAQVTEAVKTAAKPTEDAVKTITNNVTKQVDAASKKVEDTVKSTVEYISNTINGFTLIGGVADELKKQFALIPMGKPYTKGNGFNMFEPDPKQLPAIRKSAELAAYDNIIDAEYREIEPLEKKRDIEAAIASIREKIHNRDKDSQFYHDTEAEQKKLDILKEQTAEYEKQRDYERALVGHFAYDGGKELNKDSLAYLSDKFKDVKTPEVFGQEQAQKAKEAGDQVKVTVDDVRNRINEVVNDIKQSIANIIKVIRVANDILHKTAIGIISAFQMAGNAIQRIISLFGNLANRVKETNKQTNILKGTWTELNSMVRLLSGAFNKLFNNQFINEGRQLLSSIQSLNMIIGSELTAETISWAENLEYAFGLSAAELISNLKQVSAILYGLGMSSKNVAIAGKNLETVGMQLSVVTGYDYSTVMSKIQSGLKGMTQSVDDLGISVRETQMDAFLKKLKAQGGEYANIGTSFSQLTEQQRIYVRYAAIMDQITSRSAYSAENYAKSLETITGKMSILTSQLKALKASIGTLALKLFEKIIMPLTYIVYLVNQLIKKIAELLGIDIKLDVGMNGGEAQEPIDDITDGINDMADAADKAKGSLDGLDHVSTMSDSKNNIKDAFDYSKLMDINGDYSDLLSQLEDMNNNYIEKCKEALLKMLEDMKNKITDWVKDVTGRFIDWDYIKSNFYGAWVNIKNTFKNIIEIAKNAWKIIGGLLWSIGDDLDFSRLIFKFTKAFERLTKLVAVILDKIQKPIQDMYDKYLSPYVEKLGDWIEDKLNTLIAYFNNMIGWWEDPRNKDAIDDWFDNLGKHIKAIIVMFKGLFGGELTDEEKDFLTTGESYEKGFYKMYNTATKVHDAIMGIVVAIKVLAGIPLDLDKDLDRFDRTPNQVKTLIGICQTLHNILKNIWDIIRETITTIFDFNNSGALDGGDLQIALDWIKEKLEWFKKWFDENKETIINVLSEAAKTVGKIGEVKLDIIMQVLEFITSHGELIENVLKSVQELLDFVAKHPVVAITAAIGLQVAGTLVKGYLTARFWKWALGLNGATTAGTSIGSSIAGAIHAGIMKLKWGSVIAELDGLSASEVAATSSFGLTGAAATAAAVGIVGTTIAAVTAELKAGIPQVKSLWDDMWADFGNDFGSFTDEFGNKREITTDNTKAWAYDIHEALKRVYGDEIPTGAFDNAMSHVMAELESTGELTFEQTEAIRKNIEKQYEAMGDTGWLDEWNYSTENSEQIINNLSESLTGLSEDVSSTSNEVKGTVSETKTSVNSDIDDINKKTQELNNNWSRLHAPLGSFANDFKNQFRSIYTTVSQICAGLSSRISNLFSRVGQLVSRSNQLNNWASSVTSKTSGWSPIKLKGFGYANGGVPSSGSIFFANENGNTELVGNFGGYTGVANQSMIIEAMQNAMVQAIRSAGGMGNGGTTVNNFNIGNWLGDDASVRKLANRINTVNAKSNSNIANVGFVMS